MKCPICSVSSESVDSFLQHVNQHLCAYCPIKYHFLPNHAYACQNAVQIATTCQLCSSSFTSIVDLVDHYTRHICEKCKMCSCKCEAATTYHQTATGLVTDGEKPGPSGIKAQNSTSEANETKHVHDDHKHIKQPRKPRATKSAHDAYRDMQKRMCGPCQIRFANVSELQQHIYSAHWEDTNLDEQMQENQDPISIELTREVLDETYTIYEADLSNVDAHDLDGIFYALRNNVFKTLQQLIQKQKLFKIQFDLSMQFLKEDGENVTHRFVPMESFIFTIMNKFEISHVYNLAREQYNVRIENFEENGSGLILQRINAFKFIIMNIGNLLGGATRQELPEILRTKHYTLVNVPSHDNFCFKRCILAHTSIIGHRAKIKRELYSEAFYEPYMNDPIVNWEGIEFPFCVSQISKFHNNNPDIAVNVFIYDENPDEITEFEINSIEDADSLDDNQLEIEDNEVVVAGSKIYERKKFIYETIRAHTYPLSIMKEERKITIDLLLVMNGTVGHYCLIRNLTGFFKSPLRAYTKGICRFCLQSFGATYDRHVETCAELGRQKINYPADDFLKFTKHKNRILAPYFATCDFESLLQKANGSHGETELFQKHRPVAYSYAVVDWRNELITSESYLASNAEENVAERMIAQLLELADRLNDNIDEFEKEAYRIAPEILKNVPIPKVPVECIWCGKMSKPGSTHRHHSHLPDYNFIGYLCNGCNVNGKSSRILNVFVHNLKGYDGHFILRAASNKHIVEKVDLIAQTSERISSIRINNKIQFLDSLSFFNESLDSIAQTMNQETEFNVTRKYFQDIYHDDHKVRLLLRKGVYCYSYFTEMEKYEERLPAIECFYNDLRREPCSQKDYNHAQQVWNELTVETLRDYTLIYCITDVLILIDAMIKMRKMFLNDFKIDPIHYMSISQLSFDCCLSYTGISLQILKDPDLVLFFRTALRGGFSSGGSIKYAEANNQFLPNFDPSKPNSFIMYFDINNLYPCALSSSTMYRDIDWCPAWEYEKILREGESFIMSTPENAKFGYYYEVTLFFPNDTHDKFMQFPPAPYKRQIIYNELSTRQHAQASVLGITEARLTEPKLVADLHDRNVYKVHYRTLQYYLSIGVKLGYIHRVVKFRQKPFLKPYFDVLAEKRRLAPSKLEQNFFKLLGNSIYGKCGESKEKRTSYRVIRSSSDAVKYNRKPTISRVIVLDKEPNEDDMVLVALKRLSVTLDRPVYISATCLDIAKMLHYKWFYDFALPTWNTPQTPVSLLGVDTDSFWLHLYSSDVFADMLKHSKQFDNSNFDPEHPLFGKYHSDENKKKLGYMKSEVVDGCISEFIYLRPKQYMFRVESITGVNRITGKNSYLQYDVKRGKGIDRVALERECQYEQYKECLEKNVQYTNNSVRIVSKKHQVHTVNMRKRGLSSVDSKRFLMPDGVHTLPFNHYKIKRPRLDIPEQEPCTCPYCEG